MTDELDTLNRRNVRARIHITNDEEFVHKIILDRDSHEYPDPYLRPISDTELLKQYLRRVKTAIKNYDTDDPEEEKQLQEFHDRESARVNIQIGRNETPHPSKNGVSEEVATTLENYNLRTGYGLSNRNLLWETYEKLYAELPLRQLRALAAYFTAHGRKFSDDERTKHDTTLRVINAIRFLRGDEAVDFENFITFVPIETVKEDLCFETEDGEQIELEEGVPFDSIKQELNRVINEFPTLKTALALANIGKITNYHHPALSNGVYNSLEMNISEPMDQKTGKTNRNVIVHEFFHSFQDITATRDLAAAGNAVNFDAEPHEWETIIFPNADKQAITDFQTSAKRLWFELRSGKLPELCEYQTKNIDEMYAVAFEALFENPEVLKTEQPRVYDLLTSILSE